MQRRRQQQRLVHIRGSKALSHGRILTPYSLWKRCYVWCFSRIYSRQTPRGSSKTGQQHGRQRTRPLVPGPSQSPLCGAFQCLLQIAWTSDINRRLLAQPTRTAVYGPVRTVVWQGSAGDRRPYADQTGFGGITLDKSASVYERVRFTWTMNALRAGVAHRKRGSVTLPRVADYTSK